MLAFFSAGAIRIEQRDENMEAAGLTEKMVEPVGRSDAKKYRSSTRVLGEIR